MVRGLIFAVALLAMGVGGSVGQATVIYIDDDAPNDPGPADPGISDPQEDGSADHPFDAIQEGIDEANGGDEVIVADGLYRGGSNRELDYNGKAITVRSANGAENCIIDCQNEGRGFHFQGAETLAAVVDGFTITNGFANSGGGIFCDPASTPTIKNCEISRCTAGTGGGICCRSNATIVDCVLSENTAHLLGGGISCEDSSPLITGCTITGNVSESVFPGGGGGVYCEGGSPTISYCSITNNHAARGAYYDTGGGGICCYYGGDAWISHCEISDNTSEDKGGGIFCHYSAPTVYQCAITGNESFSGGGIELAVSEAVITDCLIAANAARWGGGVYASGYSSSGAISNCTITRNRAVRPGGGGGGGAGGGLLFSYSSLSLNNCAVTFNASVSGAGIYSSGAMGLPHSPVISNCTVAHNTAAARGGGIHCYNNTHPAITNSILWSNAAPDGPEIYLGPTSFEVSPSTATLSYCDVEGGEAGTYIESGKVIWEEGNIDANPLFVDPDGPDDYPGTEDDDLRLSPGSPCIDTGDPDFIPELGAVDLDGHARVLCYEVDMGAYEFGIGDYDCDQFVNLTDFAAWQGCMTGPHGGPYDLGCEPFDFNADDHIDLSDFAGFQGALTGSP